MGRFSGKAVMLVMLVFMSGALAGAGSLNYYEWIEVGPNVVVVEVLGQEFKYVLVRVETTLRGNLAPGTEVLVDQKSANRARTTSQLPLRLLHDGRYMILLEHVSRKRPGSAMFHAISRGVDGAKEMPGEGEPALISAVKSFIDLQSLKNDGATWSHFGKYLESSNNPIVLETALEMFLKFERGRVELLPVLDPLLAHPRPAIRTASAELAGQILAMIPAIPTEETYDLLPVLLAGARTDRSPAVRIAATAAIGSMEGDQIDSILREIAARDEEQAVRYEAEKYLFRRGAPEVKN